jgi:hypothetical protein
MCHAPRFTRFMTSARKRAGSGGCFLLCRVRLQCAQAATMFSAVSVPPSHRATRCSAVQLNRELIRPKMGMSGRVPDCGSHIVTEQ